MLTQALAAKVERDDKHPQGEGPEPKKMKFQDDHATDSPSCPAVDGRRLAAGRPTLASAGDTRVSAGGTSATSQDDVKKRKANEQTGNEKNSKATKQDTDMHIDAVAGNFALDMSSLPLGDLEVRNALLKAVCAKRYVLTVFNEVIVNEVVRVQTGKYFGRESEQQWQIRKTPRCHG